MLKKFDVFPKAEESELTAKTKVGGALSLCFFVFMFSLFIYLLRGAGEQFTRTTMTLSDKPQPDTLYMNIDITVYNDCKNLHFDFMNYKRTMEIPVVSNVRLESEPNGCRVSGSINAPNAPASFHIGLGENYITDKGEHAHSILLLKNQNLSHTINKLLFGQIDGDSPLNGMNMITEKKQPYMIEYDMSLIPILMGDIFGYKAIATVSKTKLNKVRTRGIAGIVFKWNFTPISLKNELTSEPILDTVSHFLAIIGAAFVFIRFLDSFMYYFSCKRDTRRLE